MITYRRRNDYQKGLEDRCGKASCTNKNDSCPVHHCEVILKVIFTTKFCWWILGKMQAKGFLHEYLDYDNMPEVYEKDIICIVSQTYLWPSGPKHFCEQISKEHTWGKADLSFHLTLVLFDSHSLLMSLFLFFLDLKNVWSSLLLLFISKNI